MFDMEMKSTRREVEEKVLQTVESMRGEILVFLKDLIARQSIPGKELEVQQFISKKLRQMGLKVEMWEPDWAELKKHPGYVPVEMGYEGRPNVVGMWPGTGGGKSLLFNGHVDVIPVDSGSWTEDPWSGGSGGGKLFGRGASDMKSGLASMTMAVEALLRSGLKTKGDVILEYVVDEEYSGNGTLSCIQRGLKADAGISCEAGDLEIQPATTGSMWFEVEVEGRSASMSRRWEAVSAIEKGYVLYEAISGLEKERIETISHPLYPDPKGSLACFIGQFISGNFPSAPPAKCILKGRMGVLPGEDPQRTRATVDRIPERSIGEGFVVERPPAPDPFHRILC